MSTALVMIVKTLDKPRITRLAAAFACSTVLSSCATLQQSKDFAALNNTIKIIDVNNDRGESSRISVVYAEGMAAYRPYGVDINDDYTRVLMQDYLEHNGFGHNAAETSSTMISAFYTQIHHKPQTPSPFHYSIFGMTGPSALRINHDGKAIRQERITGPSPYCSIVHLSTTHQDEEWVDGFIGSKEHPVTIKLKDNFDQEFSDFMTYHEIAHCMGADEPAADYTAAKMLLKNHENPEEALRFLELFAALRSFDTLRQNLDAYRGASESVRQAAHEFNERSKIHKETSEIWSYAMIRGDWENTPLNELALSLSIFADARESMKHRDFEGLAKHIQSLANWEEGRTRLLYNKVADDMLLLNSIAPQ